MANSETPVLEAQSQPQQERLFYLEFRLYFLGHANRSDLQKRFGLKESSASRDIALYKKLAPKNLVYDYGIKSYIPKASFVPLFAYTGTQVLTALTHGFGDDYAGPKFPEIISESPSQLPLPVIPTLASVTRAIHKDQAINIEYVSEVDGRGTRSIVPHALVDSGTRWLVRAYDRTKSTFSSFVINRIVNVEVDDDLPASGEGSVDDKQWHNILGLELQAHPSLPHPEAILLEFGMQDGDTLKMTCREALLNLLVEHWKIDTGEEAHVSEAGKYQLLLKQS